MKKIQKLSKNLDLLVQEIRLLKSKEDSGEL